MKIYWPYYLIVLIDIYWKCHLWLWNRRWNETQRRYLLWLSLNQRSRFFKSIAIVNDSSRMCFWSKWLVRCVWEGNWQNSECNQRQPHFHCNLATPFRFFNGNRFSNATQTKRDAHEHTNHKNGALCATEWARVVNKKWYRVIFQRRCPFGWGLSLNRICYIELETHKQCEKKAFDFTINYFEKPAKSDRNKKKAARVRTRLWFWLLQTPDHRY